MVLGEPPPAMMVPQLAQPSKKRGRSEEDFRIKEFDNSEVRPGVLLPKKTRVHSRKSAEATFDSDARKAYLTGFRKRKQERKKKGKALVESKARAMKTSLKKERNKNLYGDLAKMHEQWDEEAAEEVKAAADAAVSVTAVSEQRTFGEGEGAVSVSIEPWTGEESMSGTAAGAAAHAEEDEDGGGGRGGAPSWGGGLGPADLLQGDSAMLASALVTSKAKRAGWKPNTIKRSMGDKSNWLDRRQAWQVEPAFKGTAKLWHSGGGDGEIEGEVDPALVTTEDGQKPSWWANTRSNRAPPSMAKQHKQKWFQNKQAKMKGKTARRERRQIKKDGGGSRARGLKGQQRADKPRKTKGRKWM
jgi:hypothetical protein